MTIIDRGCWERGCACYDDKIDKNGVEVELKQSEQEPVAWIYTDAKGREVLVGTNTKPYENAQPIYTAPPKREWQGLTDEERNIIIEEWRWRMDADKTHLCNAIEIKLKEKNT